VDKFVELLRDMMGMSNKALADPRSSVTDKLMRMLYILQWEKRTGAAMRLDIRKPLMELYWKIIAPFEAPIAACGSTSTALEIAKDIKKALETTPPPPPPKPEPKPAAKASKAKPEPKDDSEPEDGEPESGEPESGDPGDGEPGDGFAPENDDQDGESKDEPESKDDETTDTDKEEGAKDGGDSDADGAGDDADSAGEPRDEDDTEAEGEPESEDGAEGEEDAEGSASVGSEDVGDGTDEPSDDEEDEPLSDDARKLMEEAVKEVEDGTACEDGALMEESRDEVNRYVETNKILRVDPSCRDIIGRPDVPARAWEPEIAEYERLGRQWTGAIATKLRALLVSERCPRTVRNLETGKLDTAKLHRVAQGNLSVFKRRLESVYEDSAVALVVDHSGSMGHGRSERSKAQVAQSLVCSLANDMDRLRVPFEVIGFQSEGDIGYDGVRTAPAVIEIMKSFEEPYKAARRFFAWPDGPKGNDELPIFQYAARRLWQRRETKKVMLIFSDGEVSFGSYEINSLTREACKEYLALLTRTGYKVFGFGILDTAIGYYCPNWIHINRLDPAFFATEVYGAMQKALL
jgi:outer membrane biosynthesis protein TonB